MSEIKAMTKRNLLIYFRNKSAVFNFKDPHQVF